jgi:hypothetical protein
LATGASTTNTFGSGDLSTNTIGHADTSVNTITGSTNTITGTTNINTTGTAATTLGNSTAATTVTAHGGNSTLSVANGTASLSSGTGSGYTAYSAPQTVVGASLVNGDATSRGLVDGASITNKIQGNTLVDGNMYINGSLTYTSNSSATTTVTSGTSVLPDQIQATSGQMSIANSGATGARTDANGKITNGIVTESTASFTLTNGIGNTHGLVVTESEATLSGGTRSSSMTLNDNGANFSNAQTGAPIQVHGVADGTAPYDAVNVRQLDKVATRAYSGIAQIAAMQAVPAPIAGKNYSLGMGGGFYAGQQAIAFGGKANVGENVSVGASVATGFGNTNDMAASVGAGFSW